jgi:hypothetical protein
MNFAFSDDRLAVREVVTKFCAKFTADWVICDSQTSANALCQLAPRGRRPSNTRGLSGRGRRQPCEFDLVHPLNRSGTMILPANEFQFPNRLALSPDERVLCARCASNNLVDAMGQL